MTVYMYVAFQSWFSNFSPVFVGHGPLPPALPGQGGAFIRLAVPSGVTISARQSSHMRTSGWFFSHSSTASTRRQTGRYTTLHELYTLIIDTRGRPCRSVSHSLSFLPLLSVSRTPACRHEKPNYFTRSRNVWNGWDSDCDVIVSRDRTVGSRK